MRSSRLDIVDELSEEVFRCLVTEKKFMGFLPVSDNDQADGKDSEDQGLLFQPDEEEPEQDEVAARHKDDKLQTQLTSERLQKRLLKLFYDARTYEEEQGVNILYLCWVSLNGLRTRTPTANGSRPCC